MFEKGRNLIRFNSIRLAAFLFLGFLLSSCSSLVYQPDRYMYFPPEKFKFEKTELFFTAQDGTKLGAWHFPPKDPKNYKGTIVLFHGNAENMSSHYVSLVWLVEHGYALFVFDYRGYGPSEGEPNQENTHSDSLLALSKALELHKKGKFIVYGQSLGGNIALRALYDWKDKDRVDLIVMDSTFLSYKTVARQFLAKHFLTWLFSPLGWILVSDEYASKTVVDKFDKPLLVIHDRTDPVISFSNGENIFKAWKGKKDIWDYDAKSHVGFFQIKLKENRDKFVQYIK